ncbi:hypothetical protein BPNPMPFG_006731 (plasmid) [Mesorhizobium sp. AR07]|uniref:hypothetical protein n=1 Tax=Mesorhizobium sp. AR07 TaxID=2865838 RepID=UPI00215EB6C9|nr:hypothetical protein [Mesorhizobium sp. AR07]UVK49317.1 hypothetical protein BPNPMPFG_006731 [Mesorhizobium sp. AR07]
MGKNNHIATVMAGRRNKHAAPPPKEAVLPDDLIAMLERSTQQPTRREPRFFLAK